MCHHYGRRGLWVMLLLQTAIEMNVKSARSSVFQKVQDVGNKIAGACSDVEDAVKCGEYVKEIWVFGCTRTL